MIEKPMTTNVKDAEILIELAKKYNKEILIPNGFNFKSFMSKAEEIISNGLIGEIKHLDAAFSSSLTDLFQGIPLSESNNHTFQPLASTWSDPSKGGGYGWGQLSHMFGGVFKITQLTAEKAFCFLWPFPVSGVFFAPSRLWSAPWLGWPPACQQAVLEDSATRNTHVYAQKEAILEDSDTT